MQKTQEGEHTVFGFSTSDFRTNSEIGKMKTYADTNVQDMVRSLQIANQIHQCMGTCFKYNRRNDETCRFGFPTTTAVSPCNNKNMNSCSTSPLYVIAQNGNHDIAVINNRQSAAEYIACYNTNTIDDFSEVSSSLSRTD